MRLGLLVNGRQVAVASLRNSGFLGAHLNLRMDLASEESIGDVSLVAYDTSEEPVAVHSAWSGPAVSIGDKIEIDILADGESDPPSEVNRSSEAPTNLFCKVEQARLLLLAVKTCDVALMGVADRAREAEPTEEFEKIRLAIGRIIAELDSRLISPTLRGHPSLVAEAQELGIY